MANITRDLKAGRIEKKRFQHPVEDGLYQTYLEVQKACEGYMEEGNYVGALEKMVALLEPIDAFFDGVMVMDPDEKLRQNRLNLLASVASLFSQVADFTKITT